MRGQNDKKKKKISYWIEGKFQHIEGKNHRTFTIYNYALSRKCTKTP